MTTLDVHKQQIDKRKRKNQRIVRVICLVLLIIGIGFIHVGEQG